MQREERTAMRLQDLTAPAPRRHTAVTVIEQDVTPEQAAHWLSAAAFDGQRKLRPTQVQRLAGIMGRGGWHPSEITFGVVDDQAHLLNGQHRLSAILRHGAAVPLTVIWRHYASRDDLLRAYTMYDRNLASRSVLDTFAALGLPEQLGLSRDETRWLGAAMPHIANGFRGWRGAPALSGDDARVLLMEDWAPTGRLYYDTLGNPPKPVYRRLVQAAPMAALLIVCRYHDMGPAFLEGVVRPSWAADDPMALLHKYLLNLEARVYEWVVARHVAVAWNAWVEGRRIGKLQVASTLRPIEFKGTKYNGRDVILPLGDGSGEAPDA